MPNVICVHFSHISKSANCLYKILIFFLLFLYCGYSSEAHRSLWRNKTFFRLENPFIYGIFTAYYMKMQKSLVVKHIRSIYAIK